MSVLNVIRLIIGAGLLILGVAVFAIEIFGVYKFKYVLNRMHAAAMGDTLGVGISMLGLIILSGLNFTSVKMLLVVIVLWIASPVTSHLVAKLEVVTNKDLKDNCELPEGDLEEK